MGVIRFSKVVSTLPQQLEPDTIYIVRAGDGFDLCCTDATGSIAYRIANAGTATKLQTPRTLTIGNTGKSFDGSADVSWSLAEIGATNDNGDYIVRDTRSVDTPTNLGVMGVKYEFKANSTDGLNDGGAYHAVMTFQQWYDSTGGNTHQLGFTDNGNLWLRTAPIGGTWGPWRKIYHSDNFGAASETASGIVKLATAAEAQALASAVVALTPARLADAFKGANQSLSNSGYQKLPGGLIIQWGTTGAVLMDKSLSVTFPIAFPTVCASVVAQQTIGTGGSGIVVPGWSVSSKSTTGFMIQNDHSVQVFYWIAIGY